MLSNIAVRSFQSEEEFSQMVDYFLGGSDDFLTGMGIDLAKLPKREAWIRATVADSLLPDSERERHYVAWLEGGELVGHSSISHIQFGRVAHLHLHLWRPELRGTGIGQRFLARSIDLYFERFQLKSLASEPYAGNPGPNRALWKLGFAIVRRYRTVPTPLAREQEVVRFEITREAWAALPREER